MRVWGALLVCGLALLGCGDETGSNGTLSVVDEFKRETGLDFDRCPTVEQHWKACGDEDCTCGADELAGFECIERAWGACTPAQLTVRHFVATGDWLQTDLLVLPGEVGCRVVEFYDETPSPACKTIARSDCEGVGHVSTLWECSIGTGGCGDRVVVVKDPDHPSCNGR